MIRREIQLPGQPPQWLLISQVEHARISGLLAQRCWQHFGRLSTSGGRANAGARDLSSVRVELLQAIAHHDDGWAVWEAQPQLDAEHHRPLSFRELPHEVSLPIWTASIEAAAGVGPLAAGVVSGHFLALLLASHNPLKPRDADWQQRISANRAAWLAEWQAVDRALHTRALADEALLCLQLFDVMSLWICSACPGAGEQVAQPPESYHAFAGQPSETEFCYGQNQVCIKPWRFDVPGLRVEAAGWLVPIQAYRSAGELLAARAPIRFTGDFLPSDTSEIDDIGKTSPSSPGNLPAPLPGDDVSRQIAEAWSKNVS